MSPPIRNVPKEVPRDGREGRVVPDRLTCAVRCRVGGRTDRAPGFSRPHGASGVTRASLGVGRAGRGGHAASLLAIHKGRLSTGEWKYLTRGNIPDLDAKSGTVNVIAATGSKHGPVLAHKTLHFASPSIGSKATCFVIRS
jgi:hypothetical protein